MIRYDSAHDDEMLSTQQRRCWDEWQPSKAGIDADLPPVRCRLDPDGAA